MTEMGFQLNPVGIAEQIHRDITTPGWHLSVSLDSYAHPDFETGMMVVHDPVDRAVVTFVGSRKEAETVVEAARKALGADGAD